MRRALDSRLFLRFAPSNRSAASGALVMESPFESAQPATHGRGSFVSSNRLRGSLIAWSSLLEARHGALAHP